MRLSKKAEYALRALTELALNQDGGNLQAQELARREQMPVKFLEQILLALKKGNILQSHRGARGGYTLNRPAERISLGEVVQLIDGPVVLLDCIAEEQNCSCKRAKICGLRDVVTGVRDGVVRLLDEVSLADICARAQELRTRQDSTPPYSI